MTAPEPSLFDTVATTVDPLTGPGQARRTDPDTSQVAAKMIKAKATTARVRLLRAFYDTRWDARGLTDEEAAERGGLSLASEYATRCSELRRADLIRVTGGSRRGRSGAARELSSITTAGISVMMSRVD